MMNIGREMWLNMLIILYVVVYYNILRYLYATTAKGADDGGCGIYLRILRLLTRRDFTAVVRLDVKVRRLPPFDDGDRTT